MDLSLQSTAINCVLQDLKDRAFITSVKRQFDNLPEEERNENNNNQIMIWLNDIINRNIIEKNEAIYELSNKNFTDDLRELIDDTTQYTKKYKRDILTKLSSNSNISILKPRITKLINIIEQAELVNGKKAIDMLYDIYDEIDELQKVAYKTKTSSMAGNVVIIDPIDKSTHNTMGPLLEELKQAVSNKIKSIPVIDGFVGGGFAPKSFNLFAAIGGNGKSLSLQNILLYAAKNNDVDMFDIDDGLKPCLVFISLELSKKQCFQRQLAWCGKIISDDDLKLISEEDLEKMVIDEAIKAEFKIPIIYIERIQGEYITNINDIISECNNLINQGFQPVMVAIDYIDRMDVLSAKHRGLSLTGADGSSLLRQKGAECRELAFKLTCPVISAAQLNGEAQGELTKVEPYLRQVDILHHFGTGMLAGSKQLQTEIENIIFQHKIDIENKSQEGENFETTQFIAMSVMKSRDGVSYYKLSSRDRENEVMYRKYTQNLRNSAMSEFLKETARLHAVIPLNGFRLDEVDYGKSIRMFYTSDKTEFVSLSDLISKDYSSVMDYGDFGDYDAEVNSRMNDLSNM